MNSSSSVASSLQPRHRQELAFKVLSLQEPVSHLANREQVSRKFLYQQKAIAQIALNTAFDKSEKDNEVLYYLPVTQKWIVQLILGLILICHCSYRGVIELLRDLFDYSLSVGTIHNRVQEAVQKARKINQSQDLSSIEVALLDELFQGNRPVLTGIDAHSTYCFLLEEVEHRDEDTWGYYLLEAEEQGLNPDYTIADAGKGIRAGQKAAWENIPCHGDVWHILEQCETISRSLTNKAIGATNQREKLEQKMELAKLKGKGNKISAKLTRAIKHEQNLLKLVNDIKILLYWLRTDILSLADPEWPERLELIDFIIEELKIRETKDIKAIKSLRIALSNQKEDLLAFAKVLDEKLANIAHKFQIPHSWVREVCLLMENLNSRLRNYFFLRKHLSSNYLELLRFFLNHRTFMASRKSERKGKSPKELMTGEKHPHWLSLLGFDLFQRA